MINFCREILKYQRETKIQRIDHRDHPMPLDGTDLQQRA